MNGFCFKVKYFLVIYSNPVTFMCLVTYAEKGVFKAQLEKLFNLK